MEVGLTSSKPRNIKWQLSNILSLGFFSGLPLALTSTTLQAWYTVQGVDIITIGALSLVGFAYVYKWLWAFLLDYYQLPFLTRRRGWIILAQVFLVLGLVIMAYLDPKANPAGLAFMACIVAFFSASQDISIDAYRAENFKLSQKGLANALYIIGYRLGMLVSGSLALLIAGYISWQATYLIMAILMLLSLFNTWLAHEPLEITYKPPSLKQAIVAPIKEFMLRPYALKIIAFILAYKLGDALVIDMTIPFLLRHLQLSLVQIGLWYNGLGPIAVSLGVLIAGLTTFYLSLYWSLMLFGILQALSNLLLAYLAFTSKSTFLVAGIIFAENFCQGLATVGLVTLLMQLCDKRYTATQFALLSALALAGKVIFGPLAGWLVTVVGWLNFYLYSFVFALPGLLLLYFIRPWFLQQASKVELSRNVQCQID